MSASAILSIVAVAAPSTGGASPTATGEFEAMLTTEMDATAPSPTVPTISPAPSDANEAEAATDDGPAMDATAEPPSDLTVSPVWFQMAQVDSVSPLPKAATTTEASAPPTEPTPTSPAVDVATTGVLSFLPLRTPVTGSDVPEPVQASVPSGYVIPESDTSAAILQGLPLVERSASGMRGETLNAGSNATADLSADDLILPQGPANLATQTGEATSRQADRHPPVKPSGEITPATNSDPAFTRSSSDKASDAAVFAPTTPQTRPAEPVGLAAAALNSLRQMPGSEALQQARISQRKTALPTAAQTPSVGPANPSATAEEPFETRVAVPSPSSLPVAGEPVRNAASTRSPTLDGQIQAPDATASSSSPTVKAETPIAAAASSPDAAIDLATAVKSIAPMPLDIALTTDAPLEPGSPVVAGTSPATSTSIAAAPGGLLFSGLSRATIETTANLAAQITSRLVGRSTRLELGLTPEGLGRVDVTLDIDDDGQLSARLAFDNPLAATELRGRADELRRQLEDAGFTLARDALDFSSRDNPSGGERRQQRASAYADRHAANDDMIDIASTARMPSSNRLTPQGVDVKV